MSIFTFLYFPLQVPSYSVVSMSFVLFLLHLKTSHLHSTSKCFIPRLDLCSSIQTSLPNSPFFSLIYAQIGKAVQLEILLFCFPYVKQNLAFQWERFLTLQRKCKKRTFWAPDSYQTSNLVLSMYPQFIQTDTCEPSYSHI